MTIEARLPWAYFIFIVQVPILVRPHLYILLYIAQSSSCTSLVYGLSKCDRKVFDGFWPPVYDLTFPMNIRHPFILRYQGTYSNYVKSQHVWIYHVSNDFLFYSLGNMTPYTHIHADLYMDTYNKMGLFISLKFLSREMYKCDFEFYFSNNAAHDKMTPLN